MIGKLSGRLDDAGADHALIDVGGVGYVAFCSARTLESLPPRGTAVQLFIETVLREDLIRLYGFVSPEERDWFRLLQSVQGVGAKVALAILSTLPPDALASAIALGDKAAIGRAPGIGKKLAERICVELKDKAPAGLGLRHQPLAAVLRAPQGAAAEAVSALANLGYAQTEAAAAVAAASAELGADAALDALIRNGLKRLAR